MRTDPALRPRFASEQVMGGIGTQGAPVPVQPATGRPGAPGVGGGLWAGLKSAFFGRGDPTYGKNLVPVGDVPPGKTPPGLYNFHEGDLFNPGTGNYVFEPAFDNPLFTIWGKAFMRTPNTFSPVQSPQIWAAPTVTTNGLGGLQAGTMALQPLESQEGQ